MKHPIITRVLTSLATAAAGGLLLTACHSNSNDTSTPSTDAMSTTAESKVETPPAPKREFRAAWVATVTNIDWPSRPGLPTDQQKQEVIQILDRLVELNMNAVVLQVRTSCDALYDSKLEPWSEFLTGTQGKAPVPYYDPLKFWIDEAHARGLELHAWLNPYRARIPGAKTPNAATHVSNKIPNAVRSFNGYQWLDPSEPAAAKQTLDVFLDVVRRYDVDGIHMDDYFYPYPEYLTDKKTNKVSDFPDDEPWKKYQASGGKLSRADWRRKAVDDLVEQLYKGIHKEKKWVKFGISPFGIWKDGYPEGMGGFSQYDKLYADAKLWLNKGWVDYYTPQLYWKLSYPEQNYLALLNWWVGENTHNRYIIPGLFTSKIGDGETAWSPDAILDQMGVNRAVPGVAGEIHFSMAALTQNRDRIGNLLTQGRAPYASDALMPAYTWLDKTAPTAPIVKLEKAPRAAATQVVYPATTQSTGDEGYAGRRGGRRRSAEQGGSATTQAATTQTARVMFRPIPPAPAGENPVYRSGAFQVSWQPKPGEPVFQWAVYTKVGKKWTLQTFPASTTSAVLYDTQSKTLSAKDGKVTTVAVAAVDRSGNASKWVVLPRTDDVTTKIDVPTTKPATTQSTTRPRTSNGLEQ